MKKVFIPVIALFVITVFSSCSKGSSPETATTNFLNAVNERNWDEAQKYATKESEELLTMVKGMAENMPDSATTMKFEVIKDKTVIEGEGAEVTVKDENSNEMAYKLKNVEGEWKVDFTLEALLGDMSSMEDMATESMESMEGMGDSITIDMEGISADSLTGAESK